MAVARISSPKTSEVGTCSLARVGAASWPNPVLWSSLVLVVAPRFSRAALTVQMRGKYGGSRGQIPGHRGRGRPEGPLATNPRQSQASCVDVFAASSRARLARQPGDALAPG